MRACASAQCGDQGFQPPLKGTEARRSARARGTGGIFPSRLLGPNEAENEAAVVLLQFMELWKSGPDAQGSGITGKNPGLDRIGDDATCPPPEAPFGKGSKRLVLVGFSTPYHHLGDDAQA